MRKTLNVSLFLLTKLLCWSRLLIQPHGVTHTGLDLGNSDFDSQLKGNRCMRPSTVNDKRNVNHTNIVEHSRLALMTPAFSCHFCRRQSILYSSDGNSQNSVLSRLKYRWRINTGTSNCQTRPLKERHSQTGSENKIYPSLKRGKDEDKGWAQLFQESRDTTVTEKVNSRSRNEMYESED